MKPTHSKQNSLDFKLSSSLANDTYIHRTEVVANTYRKKTHHDEHSTPLTLYRPPSTLTRHPASKNSLPKNQDPHKLTAKKSHPKLINEKSIERLKSLYKPNEINATGLKTKLTKVVNVLTLCP